MKAVFIRKGGGLDVLESGTLPDPRPGENEVLIRIAACGVNQSDIYLREHAKDLTDPQVLGSEVSGVIEEVRGESHLSVGDEVVVNPAIPCGECVRCRAGLDCQLVGIFGYNTQGGYAELVTAPIAQVHLKPRPLSMIEAAAFPLTFLTAWHMLEGRAALRKGENVLIWGGSGSLGSAGILVARHLGGRVIATARSATTATKLKDMGADETILYEDEDVVARVKELTDGRGADVVFESVGVATWERSIKSLAFNGRIVIAGTTSGDVASQNLAGVYYRQQSILGARMGTAEEFLAVLEAMESGRLKPLVDEVFPLADARAAQERMEQRGHFGKIVLSVS